MKILLIIFAIIHIIIKIWASYIENDTLANLKFHAEGGNLILGLLVISRYILGAIIIIKIILKLWR